ncbi:DNA-directed RNA polymerases I, II, and III subunit RPABC5 isoform X3 [Elephas maximus indicus]|uniref:DNA-directed RNA polymerases I, II, and III subunit RPABC5 isoform X3 n=1 Tax=Elephas maximus indicus TaxID=99487 RepID=UPI002116EC63|nr:DNA-directed RNA polymerases I, II, and III subunit RPABC5 isoform X3 [Elephas maximus indicus]
MWSAGSRPHIAGYLAQPGLGPLRTPLAPRLPVAFPGWRRGVDADPGGSMRHCGRGAGAAGRGRCAVDGRHGEAAGGSTSPSSRRGLQGRPGRAGPEALLLPPNAAGPRGPH